MLLEPVVVTPRTSAVTAMAASPWTSLLAVAGQKQILLYDTDSRELAGILPYPEGYARSLKFSANGSLLVMGGGRGGKLGHAIVWDVKTGKRVAELGKEFDQVMSADISPDHRKVVIATNAKKVKCFDVATGEQLGREAVADEAGGAGDENFHELCESLTGDARVSGGLRMLIQAIR